jgi:hypothetical protein
LFNPEERDDIVITIYEYHPLDDSLEIIFYGNEYKLRESSKMLKLRR